MRSLKDAGIPTGEFYPFISPADLETEGAFMVENAQFFTTKDQQEKVAYTVAPIRTGELFTLTLGVNNARSAFVKAFSGENSEPIGPLVIVKIPKDNGRTYWDIQDAPDAVTPTEDDTPF